MSRKAAFVVEGATLLTKMHSHKPYREEELKRLSEKNSLIANEYGFEIDDNLKRNLGPSVKFVNFNYADSEEFKNALRNEHAIGFTVSRTKTAYTPDVLSLMKDRGILGVFYPTSSTPGLDPVKAKEFGIAVYNTKVNGKETAAFAFNAVIDHLNGKKVNKEFLSDQWAQGRYPEKDTVPYSPDEDFLKGKKIGIFGFGDVGKSLSKHFDKAGAEINICSSARFTQEGSKKEFTELELSKKTRRVDNIADLAKCDIIINAAPYNSETHQVFNEGFFNNCQGSKFVQIGGCNTLDESALTEAIKSENISWAAVDTFQVERKGHNSPLYELRDTQFAESLEVSHHIAGLGKASKEAILVVDNAIKQNLEFCAGKITFSELLKNTPFNNSLGSSMEEVVQNRERYFPGKSLSDPQGERVITENALSRQ